MMFPRMTKILGEIRKNDLTEFLENFKESLKKFLSKFG